MKRIYKTLSVIVVLLLVCLCLTSCSDDFEMVKSISIVTGGETKTFRTTTTPVVELSDAIYYDPAEGKALFDAAPENRKLYNVVDEGKPLTIDDINKMSKISFADAVKSAKGSTHYETVEPALKGYYYEMSRYAPNGYTYYTRMSYIKTYFNFVYVKIKNDTTIVIKSGNNETTYQVTSYKIEKL